MPDIVFYYVFNNQQRQKHADSGKQENQIIATHQAEKGYH